MSAGSKTAVKALSNQWVNLIASIVLVIVATVAAIVLERMGDLQSELGQLSKSVDRVDELDELRERVILLEAGGQFISHAQLSSSISQYPNANGEFFEMDHVDSIKGSIEFDPRRDKTRIRILEDGSYFLFVVPQVRRLEGYSGEACFTTWLVINGKDLANSSIKNCFSAGTNWSDTLTTTLQTILPMHGGETIQIRMRSHPDGKSGAVAIVPEDAPLVPAAIISLVRVGG